LFSQSPPPQLAYRVIREYIVDNRIGSHGLSSPRHRQQHGVQDACNLTCSEYTVHGIFAKLPGFRTFRRFENSRNVEVSPLVFVSRTFERSARKFERRPCLAKLPRRYGAAEPVLETRRADARVIAGGEALIVQFDAEVKCVDICGYLPRVSVRAQELSDEFELTF